MHELSLAQALVDQVVDVLHQEGESRVASIKVEIGALSGVEREAFEFAFPFACEQTPLEGARLDVVDVSVRIRCRVCGAESCPEPPMILCLQCQSADCQVLAGHDFMLKSLEVW